MEKQNAMIVFLLVVTMVISVIGFMAVNPQAIDEEALANQVTAQVIAQIPVPDKMPTAAEVAALVPAVEIPEIVFPDQEALDNDKLQDLWEDLYGEDINELEDVAYDFAELELEDDDYDLLVEYLEGTIDGFDELEDVDVDDYEITVIELGLNDDEDKVVVIEFELEIEYTLLTGVVQDYKDQILATATVIFDEGDLDDEDVELVFA